MIRFRRLVQLAFLTAFFGLFLITRFPYAPPIATDSLLRTSPLGPPFTLLAGDPGLLRVWPGLLVLLSAFLVGRMFCGWICPFGTLIDLFGKVFGRPTRTGPSPQSWRSVKYGILLAAGVCCLFGIPLWGFFDPLSMAHRVLTLFLFPLFTLVMEPILQGLGGLPGLGGVGGALLSFFRRWIRPEAQGAFQGVWTVGLLFLVVIGLEQIHRRFWCRHLCPAGALLGICSSFRIRDRRVSEACVQCGRCTRECKMGAIPDQRPNPVDKAECIECFGCENLCPPGTAAVVTGWTWPPVGSPDLSRRRFVEGAGTGALLTAFGKLNLRDLESEARLLRPPGSLTEPLFLERCVRCQACVRVCQTNGGCLQPATLENGWSGLWAPRANMRTGYCEVNCNLCGQVCPTQAIQPLPLEEKQKTPLGLAFFNKDLCIPWARNTDCLVCEEHCPVSEKAIQFDEREVKLPDGTKKLIKFPYVVGDRCIGCGICEHKCPLPGFPGVYVTNENQKRMNRPRTP